MARNVAISVRFFDTSSMHASLSPGQLRDCGYTVLEASDGGAAIQTADTHAGRIDLLLTDVVMEGMTGSELYGRLIHERPGIKVLFMSGHAREVVSGHGIAHEKMDIIQKPFTKRASSEKVREVLQRA